MQSRWSVNITQQRSLGTDSCSSYILYSYLGHYLCHMMHILVIHDGPQMPASHTLTQSRAAGGRDAK